MDLSLLESSGYTTNSLYSENVTARGVDREEKLEVDMPIIDMLNERVMLNGTFRMRLRIRKSDSFSADGS